MKSDKDKDITERMVEMLRKHSVPYKEGAWEQFKAYEAGKKKKVILWPYLSGAAAIILLGTLLFLRQEPILNNSNPAVVQTDRESRSYEDMGVLPGDIEKTEDKTSTQGNHIETATLNNEHVERDSHDAGRSRIAYVEPSFYEGEESLLSGMQEQKQQTVLNDNQTVRPLKEEKDLVDKNTKQSQNAASEAIQPNRSYDEENAYRNGEWALVDEPEINSDMRQGFDKWDFSVEIAPSINERQQINFGGGLAVAYNINEKISISSGVSYVQLDAQRGPNQIDIPAEFSKASLNSYSYNKSLNTINTTLVGLDIPVNLKVNLGKQLYASAGVSVFSVLSEDRYNVFEEKIAQVASLSDDGQGKRVPAIQTVYSQEISPNSPYEGKNFTGFFNLSVGYRLPVLKNLNLSLEPYLRVPVGSLTDQDMNLSNGGLKIVTSF
ncbi:hypothetical protein [Albibacterium profundi]|uniref:Outer membrane protein beta-barrel domain-containing protein n=1 Tax=Albibacterium profundi TaxID=3134906 RepID=A0ABV5CA35_9SPHI